MAGSVQDFRAKGKLYEGLHVMAHMPRRTPITIAKPYAKRTLQWQNLEAAASALKAAAAASETPAERNERSWKKQMLAENIERLFRKKINDTRKSAEAARTALGWN